MSKRTGVLKGDLKINLGTEPFQHGRLLIDKDPYEEQITNMGFTVQMCVCVPCVHTFVCVPMLYNMYMYVSALCLCTCVHVLYTQVHMCILTYMYAHGRYTCTCVCVLCAYIHRYMCVLYAYMHV